MIDSIYKQKSCFVQIRPIITELNFSSIRYLTQKAWHFKLTWKVVSRWKKSSHYLCSSTVSLEIKKTAVDELTEICHFKNGFLFLKVFFVVQNIELYREQAWLMSI